MSPVWNPTRTNLKTAEADQTGKLAKFNQKFGFVDAADTSNQAKIGGDAAAEADAPKEEAPKTQSRQSLMQDYMDLMGENIVPVQRGGRVAGKKKHKK